MAQYWSDHSLQFGLQSTLYTASTVSQANFATLKCTEPTVKFDTDVAEVRLNKGVVGAAPDVQVGRRSGTLTFEIPCEGFNDGYDPTSEEPGGTPAGSAEVIPPWMILVANALGCNIESLAGATLADKNTNFWRGTFLSNAGYGATKVTASGTDSTHIQGDGGEGANHKGGQLIAAALDASTAPFLGFIKTKAVDLMTVFEPAQAASANYDDDAANVYPTTTAWASDDEPAPLTCYWTGPNTKACYVLVGCVCESWEIARDDGGILTASFQFRFFDFYLDKTKGGLVVPDAYDSVPPVIGGYGGALLVAGTIKCGIEDFKVRWQASLRVLTCFSAPQGYHSVGLVDRKVRITCSIPHDADNDLAYDATGSTGNVGSHYLQSALELGNGLSIGVYVGPRVGRCLAMLMPVGRITAAPDAADRDGIIAYSVQFDADAYTNDQTDTAETSANSPLDSIYRIALA